MIMAALSLLMSGLDAEDGSCGQLLLDDELFLSIVSLFALWERLWNQLLASESQGWSSRLCLLQLSWCSDFC